MLDQERIKSDSPSSVEVSCQVTSRLPTDYGEFIVKVYQEAVSGQECLALICGSLKSSDWVLTRVHSSCTTGDIFHSQRCDCGYQMKHSMELISERGSGIIIYSYQEGRGIGLVNKLKAYNLQDQGFDTYGANRELGFLEDERDYTIPAAILSHLGISKIKMLTNNPHKVKGLHSCGIKVKPVPLYKRKLSKDQHKYLYDKFSLGRHSISPEVFQVS